MVRHLFTLASALSLLLCAATVVLWIRSYRGYDFIQLQPSEPPSRLWLLRSSRGIADLTIERNYRSPYLEPRNRWLKLKPRNDPVWREPAHPAILWQMGFRFRSGVMEQRWPFISFAAPYWAILLPLVVLPAVRIIGFMARRRRWFHQQCPTCGYLLVGNTSGVCPECGTPAPGDDRAKPDPGSGRRAASSVDRL